MDWWLFGKVKSSFVGWMCSTVRSGGLPDWLLSLPPSYSWESTKPLRGGHGHSRQESLGWVCVAGLLWLFRRH